MLRVDTLGYDDNGRLTSDCRISESPEGVEADWDSCAAGVPKLDYSYDRAGQLTAAAWSDNSVPTAGITAWGYTYDNRGTRSAATVSDATGTHATVFGYDAAAQLMASSSTTGGVNATYGYDKAGRRTSRTDTAATVTSTYDPFGRLKGVDGDDPQYRYYGADGHLEAISTVGPGQTPDVDLFWDPASPGGVPQVLDVTLFGSLSIRSAFAGERLNLDAGENGQLWYSYDVAGSAIGDGQDYNPNGERIDDNPTNFFNYRGELNLTPDLIHLRNRDYDPATATFTTRDPLDGVDGTATDANPYHYADNDPINKTDPLGLRPQDCDASGTANDCDAVVEVLKRYFPRWEKFNPRIQTSCGGGDGWANKPVLCVDRGAVESRYARGAFRYTSPSARDAFEATVLHEMAHLAMWDIMWPLEQRHGDYPSLLDLEAWRLQFDPGNQLHLVDGIHRIEAERGTSGVNELLADCVSEVLKPEVYGGYWRVYVGADRCTSHGLELARHVLADVTR